MATQETPIWFRTTCRQNGIDVSDHQLSELEKFASLLLEWNIKINLISRRDEANIWTYHILHSASILFKLDIRHGAVVLDLGTGGGLPGIPLKILRPDITITLLDSTQKKINVVREMVDTLGLKGVNVVWGRAEDLGKKTEYAHTFDVVIARAVASLKDLLDWSAPFLRRQERHDRGDEFNEGRAVIGPSLIALKGGNLDSELRQIERDRRVDNISIINLTLEGSSQLEGEDKKIVVVKFGPGRQQKED